MYPLAMPASSERAVRFYSRQSRSAKTLVRAYPKTPKGEAMKNRIKKQIWLSEEDNAELKR